MSSQVQSSVSVLIQNFGEQRVLGFFLVLARLSPLFVLAPLFSSHQLPSRVRGIVAVALAIGISPVVTADTHLSTDLLSIATLIAKEVLVGSAFSYTLAALFAAVSVAGSLLDTSIGFSYGGLVDPLNGNQSALLNTVYGLIGVMVFITIGGDGWVIQGLARTYDVVGIDQYPSLNSIVAGAGAAFVGVMASALMVAGPVLLALVLTDTAFGIVSRVVPQLNVFQVGMPAKVLVGILLMGATMPFVAGWLSGQLQTDIGQALHALRVG